LHEVAPVRLAQPAPDRNTARDPVDLIEQPAPRLVIVTSHTGQRCSELRHPLRPANECVTNRTRLGRRIPAHGSARNTSARESEYCHPLPPSDTTRRNDDVTATARVHPAGGTSPSRSSIRSRTVGFFV